MYTKYKKMGHILHVRDKQVVDDILEKQKENK